MTIDYNDYVDLLNSYNLTGNAYGTSVIPSISLGLDLDNHYIVSYTFFRNYSDITATNYYDSDDTDRTRKHRN